VLSRDPNFGLGDPGAENRPNLLGQYTLQADRKRWFDAYEEQSESDEEEDSEP
jgi:hypothetical protein